jgi:hypothetical protein
MALSIQVIEIVVRHNQLMLPYLGNGDALCRVGPEQLPEQILSTRTQVLWLDIHGLLGLEKKLVHVRVVKGKTGTETGIQNDAHAPYIYCCARVAVGLAVNKFGCSIVRASAGGSELVRWTLLYGRHAKVSNFDLTSLGEENILRLEISMANVERVAIVKCANDLSEIEYGFWLREAAHSIDVVKEITVLNELEDEVTVNMLAGQTKRVVVVDHTFLSGSPRYRTAS